MMKGKGGWVVAVCAILLSITGSATAAKLITGKQIKNNSVTGQDVKNGSLASGDLSASARDALKGNVGPAGAPGAPGAPGAAGAPGPAGPSGIQNITTVKARTELCSGTASCSIGVARAVCPSGSKPVSGGGGAVSAGGLFVTVASSSNGQADGWGAGGDNYGGGTGAYVEAFAYCSTGVSSFQTASVQQMRSASASAPASASALDDLAEQQFRLHEGN